MQNKFPTTINKAKRGYTIIETMISVSLFIVIVMTGMDALLNANLLHQKSQDMRSILDNLSFIMEDMSRNVRTGKSYHCFITNEIIQESSVVNSTPQSCSTGWAIAFEPALGNIANNNDQWIYYIAGGKIFKSTQGPYTASNFVQLTPDEVNISSVSSFSVLGAPGMATDSQQPFVNIRLVGTVTFKNVVTPFSLQTSVSQRLVDI